MTAITNIVKERERQIILKKSGRFKYTPSDSLLQYSDRLCMLAEEVGEVARCVLSMKNLVQEQLTYDQLYKELSQVAAISLAWMEGIESELGRKL